MSGSVDDGKSTLIGRLLHDQRAVYEDQMDSVRSASRDGLDLALITDGLRMEREQGITIDVAYRYFATPRRRFIVADTPGHDQYTRNMVTGASTADVSVILIDVTRGVLPQTRRHAYLSWILGIRHLCVAINKMDAVGYSQDKFQEILGQFEEAASKMSGCNWTAIPVSALEGDNVVRASDQMPWHQGPTLIEFLESIEVRAESTSPWLRLPVQTVIRGQNSDRSYAGRIAAGSIKIGDEVIVLPSSRTARVTSITGAGSPTASAPQSVSISLDEHIDISRGDMIAEAAKPPAVSRRFVATIFWMSNVPLTQGRSYLLKHTTQRVPAEITKVVSKLNIDNLEHAETLGIEVNDIGRVEIETRRPLFCDLYSDVRDTGAFILVDPASNDTVAAGTIEKIFTDRPRNTIKPVDGQGVVVWLTGLSSAGKSTLGEELFDRLRLQGVKVEMLDGDIIRQRLCKDLGFTKEDRDENIRRVGFVAELLAKNGVVVIVSAISPYRAGRDDIRSRIPGFVEVYVNAPIDVCEHRDVKGLYRKARAGQLRQFTGIDDPYEAPLHPEVECRTDLETIEESVGKILDHVKSRLAAGKDAAAAVS